MMTPISGATLASDRARIQLDASRPMILTRARNLPFVERATASGHLQASSL